MSKTILPSRVNTMEIKIVDKPIKKLLKLVKSRRKVTVYFSTKGLERTERSLKVK